MSTTILNFKKLEVVGATKEEALANAPFSIMRDATQKFKHWKQEQTKGITDKDIKMFCLDYLAANTKNVPGVGCSITLESAVSDTRERPYKIEDVKNEEGKRKFKTMYKWVDRETGVTVCAVDTNKADAKNAIKELYKNGSYKGKADLVKTKDVVEGQAVVATAEYTPSKNTKNGTWLVFGIEA